MAGPLLSSWNRKQLPGRPQEKCRRLESLGGSQATGCGDGRANSSRPGIEHDFESHDFVPHQFEPVAQLFPTLWTGHRTRPSESAPGGLPIALVARGTGNSGSGEPAALWMFWRCMGGCLSGGFGVSSQPVDLGTLAPAEERRWPGTCVRAAPPNQNSPRLRSCW